MGSMKEKGILGRAATRAGLGAAAAMGNVAKKVTPWKNVASAAMEPERKLIRAAPLTAVGVGYGVGRGDQAAYQKAKAKKEAAKAQPE